MAILGFRKLYGFMNSLAYDSHFEGIVTLTRYTSYKYHHGISLVLPDSVP